MALAVISFESLFLYDFLSEVKKHKTGTKSDGYAYAGFGFSGKVNFFKKVLTHAAT